MDVTVAPDRELFADRYHLGSPPCELGRGGMGVVYRAWDVVLQRPVALKVLRSELASEPSNRRQFQREAVAVASLHHPALVSVIDFGSTPDHGAYLAMQFLEGWRLGALVPHADPSPGLPWPVVGLILDHLLAGLAHMHSRGIVHRDVKPDNIMLRRDGDGELRACLCDFGIAHFTGAFADERPAPQTQQLIMGTLPYTPPEQLDQALFYAQCPATDLWAVGALIHKLCCGSHCFDISRGVLHAAMGIIDGTRRPFEPSLPVPAQLHDAVDALLSPRPWQRNRRSGSAAMLRRELRPLWNLDEALSAWRALCPERPSASAGPQPQAVSALDSKASRVAVPRSLRLHRPPLIGREAEQRALCRLAAQAVDGSRCFALLSGAAGMGKTRLALDLAETIQEQGSMEVLHASFARTRGAHDGLPGAIERYYHLDAADGREVREALLGYWADEGANTLAGTPGQAFAPDSGGSRSQALPADPSWSVDALTALLRPDFVDKGRVESGVREAIARAATRIDLLAEAALRVAGGRPLLLLIDDAPRADSETLASIERIDGQLERLLLIATARTEECGEPSWARLRALAPPGRLELELTPLDTHALSGLLDELVPLHRDAIFALADASAGNPLFALQQLYTWAAEQRLQWEPAAGSFSVDAQQLAGIAPDLGEVWRRRLRVLAEPAARAARAASALGSRFPSQLFEALLDALALPGDKLIAGLVEHQILIDAGDALHFAHDLLEQHLFERLLAEDGSGVLRTAAEVIEQHAAGDPSLLRLAARYLLSCGETRRAIVLMLDLVERSWGARKEPLALHADLEIVGGACEQLDDPTLTARWSRWWAEAAIALSLDGQAERAIERATDALDRSPGKRPLLAAHLDRMRGQIASQRSDYLVAAQRMERALGGYRAVGHGSGEIACSLALARMLWTGRSELGQAHALCKRALDLASEGDSEAAEAEALCVQAFVVRDMGRLSRAEALVERSRVAFDRVREPLGLGQCCFLAGLLAGDRGELDRARTQVERAAEHFAAAGEWWWQAVNALQRGAIDAALGRREQALQVASSARQQIAAQAHRLPHEEAQCWLVTARAHLVRGSLESAREALDRAFALDSAEPMLQQPLSLIDGWLAAIEGDEARAASSVERAAALWRELGLTAWGVPWLLRRLAQRRLPREVTETISAWQASLT